MIRGVIAGNFDVLHPGYIAMFDVFSNKMYEWQLDNMIHRMTLRMYTTTMS